MTEYVYLPIPTSHLPAILRAVADVLDPTLAPLGIAPLGIKSTKSTDLVEIPLTDKPHRGTRVGTKLVERTKTRIKTMPEPFTVKELAVCVGISANSARTALYQLVSQGWAAQVDRVQVRPDAPARVNRYRYVPAKETPITRTQDPPDVTGRGAAHVGNGPVAHTGKPATARGDMGKLINTVRQQGWTAKRTGSGHYQLRKGSAIIIVSGTASDPHAVDNARSQLRKAGANV